MTNTKVGMNGRFFPNNWRPVLEEIRFAHDAGFYALQFRGKESGLTDEHLGAPFEETERALKAANLTATMELLIRLQGDGRTRSGRTPLEVLRANLAAIHSVPCRHVHWHLVLEPAPEHATSLEGALLPEFRAATELAARHGFTFAFEHNEPAPNFFATPQSCAATLDAVPELRFVWDLNHTVPASGRWRAERACCTFPTRRCPKSITTSRSVWARLTSWLTRGLFCGRVLTASPSSRSAACRSRAVLVATPTTPS